MKKNFFLKILSIFFSIITAAAFIEVSGQIYALAHPSFEVLTLEPDPFIGWKHTPNLQWPWAGNYWYQRDFRLDIRNNSLGFRDSEHAFTKPDSVIRIAMLGDSFIEALQVPLEKTAGFLLEKKLDAAATARGESKKCEVLNFGVSGHGVGQYLLTWEHYASKFKPDYAFVFVTGRTLERTVTAEEWGNFPETEKLKLKIRPTFRVENDKLISIPAKDYDRLAAIHKELIQKEFGGRLFRRRRPGIFLAPYFNQLAVYGNTILRNLILKMKGKNPNVLSDQSILLKTNLKIIEKLRDETAQASASLILVDATTHFEPTMSQTSAEIRKFCSMNHIQYIALAPELDLANRQGRSTRWRHDAHFNETGNEVFAETMFRWFTNQRLSNA